MASINPVNPKKYFWIQDEKTCYEVKAALEEDPPSEIHPRVAQEIQKIKLVVMNHHLLDTVRKELLQFVDTHDLFNFFDDDLDTMPDDKLNKIVGIRKLYILFGQLLAVELRRQHLLYRKVQLSAELYKMAYILKPMVYNSTYFTPFSYKAMISALLRCMANNGFLFALVLFCELCPDFVTPECYPKFKVIVDTSVNTFDCLGHVSKTSTYNECVFNDPFYLQLYNKHAALVQFVLVQNCKPIVASPVAALRL